MVPNDLVVEVPEDALDVVDQPEEAPSDVAEFTFANGQARRDLHVLHCPRDDLLAEVNNSLL